MRLLRVLASRAIQAVLTLAALSVLLFALLASMPGSAADLLVMSNPNVRPEDITRLLRLSGLDRPWYVQYWRWLYGHQDALARPVVDLPSHLALEDGGALVLPVPQGLTVTPLVDFLTVTNGTLRVSPPGEVVPLVLAVLTDAHGQEALWRATLDGAAAPVPRELPVAVMPVEGALRLELERVLPGATQVTVVRGPGEVVGGAWRLTTQGMGQQVVVLEGQQEGRRVRNAFVVEWSPLPDPNTFRPGALFGELGYSTVYKRPVAQLLAGRIPATLRLILPALVLAALLALLLGAWAGQRQGSVLDRAVLVVSTLATSVPVFWSGVLLVLLFAVELRWFPPGGMEPVGGGDLLDAVEHAVLPTVVLTLFYGGRFLRYVRDAVVEVMAAEYMRTARAVGLPPWRVMVWALRAAIIPFVTVLALSVPAMFSGALLTETVFSWPGMGRLIYDAVLNSDHGVAMVAFLLSAALVLLGNAVADALHAWLDPRVMEQP